MTAKEFADLWVANCEKHFSRLPYATQSRSFRFVELYGNEHYKVVETKTLSGFTNDTQREEAWCTEYIVIYHRDHYEEAAKFLASVMSEIEKVCPEVF